MIRADHDLERPVPGKPVDMLEGDDGSSETFGSEGKQALLRGCAHPPVGVREQRHHVAGELVDPRLTDPTGRMGPDVEDTVRQQATQDGLRDFGFDLPQCFRGRCADARIEVARAERQRGHNGLLFGLPAEQRHGPEAKACLGMRSELEQLAVGARGSRLELGGGTGARMSSLDEHVEEQDVGRSRRELRRQAYGARHDRHVLLRQRGTEKADCLRRVRPHDDRQRTEPGGLPDAGGTAPQQGRVLLLHERPRGDHARR